MCVYGAVSLTFELNRLAHSLESEHMWMRAIKILVNTEKRKSKTLALIFNPQLWDTRLWRRESLKVSNWSTTITLYYMLPYCTTHTLSIELLSPFESLFFCCPLLQGLPWKISCNLMKSRIYTMESEWSFRDPPVPMIFTFKIHTLPRR